MVDTEYIRSQFPILKTVINGKYPLVYLDNAATTQKPLAVIQALTDYYTNCNANVHRGVHYLSSLATDMFEQARQGVKDFIRCGDDGQVIFTKGTTDSVNLLAHCLAKTFLSKDDTVLITQMEHHSNIVPWQIASQDYGFTLDYIPIDNNGELVLDKLYKHKDLDKVKVLSLTHISNTLGTVNPIKEITRFCRQHNIITVVDGAQSIAHQTIDVQDLGADFYCFSGHKVYAPMGIGVLYGRKELLDKTDVYQGGGEMIKQVTMEKTTYNDLPYKYEAGTPSVADAIALGKALQWFKSLSVSDVTAYEDSLLEYALQRLDEIDGIRIIGNAAHRSSCISFVCQGIHHLDLGTLLDAMGIAVRTGHHCAEPVMQFFSIEGTDRISFAVYTTRQEIDMFISALQKAVKMLR
ncbi:MAG: SufS family cysteine desulfurase [Bacteroidales bacterium]|nr:SufS family cysteine desulfurase [Bacteroidales bacterium]